MAESPEVSLKPAVGDKLDAGTYEILRNRLLGSGSDLRHRLEELNNARKTVFGSIDSKILGTDRITTEHNCTPRDMVSFGKHFLFGYNVHIGLKSETSIEDVFNIYEFNELSFSQIGVEKIKDTQFESDLKELYKYYKNTFFEKFVVLGPFLHMVFRTGKNPKDFKTFKWLIVDTDLTYQGNRSDHELKLPPQFEFEWKRPSREYHRKGLHPHISILDKVFIETVKGDLTIKVEDNTDSGEGIFSEPVDDKDQKLDDAEVYYADLHNIILLKIKPFKENDFRYIVYNHKVKSAIRIDAIKDCCVLLPDDQGIIFSKGYYLQTGEFKIYENEHQNLVFEKRIASPNGEDFLYVFYQNESGNYILLPYNIIEQKVDSLTVCSGFSIFPDGELIYFLAQEEPLKHHPILIWQSPFVEPAYIPPVVPDSFLYKIGNKDIVRCMAECMEVLNLLNKDDESYANLYLDIVNKVSSILDSYFWVSKPECFTISEPLHDIKNTASSTIEEFEKVVRVKKDTQEKVKAITSKVTEEFDNIRKAKFSTIEDYVKHLVALRTLRGDLTTSKDLRYSDQELLKDLDDKVSKKLGELSSNTVDFLLQETALDPYHERVTGLKNQLSTIAKLTEAKKLEEDITSTTHQLEMLIEIVSNLKIDDPTQTTKIIDNISLVFAEINQVKSALKNSKSEFRRLESHAEFNAQMRLIEQAVTNYLDVSTTVEKCDEYLSKLSIQLEELVGKFADFDDYVNLIFTKRQELNDAFESKKLILIEKRNNRANNLFEAGVRILNGIRNKVMSFNTAVEINGYFASDLMVERLRTIVTDLKEVKDAVKSDQIQTRIKALKDEALRQLHDKHDLYTEGENIIKFGPHHFSVNKQVLDVTMVFKEEDVNFHLTGTGFFEKVTDPEFLTTKKAWKQSIISENDNVYRGEYLAYLIYNSVKENAQSLEILSGKSEDEILLEVQKFMASRYTEAYIKGVHDHDAAQILFALLQIHKSAELLRFNTQARSYAMLAWFYLINEDKKADLDQYLKSIGTVLKAFPYSTNAAEFKSTLFSEVSRSLEGVGIQKAHLIKEASNYLFEEMVRGNNFTISLEAQTLVWEFDHFLTAQHKTKDFDASLAALNHNIVGKFHLSHIWIDAFINSTNSSNLLPYAEEAAIILLARNHQALNYQHVSLLTEIDNMKGSHKLLKDGKYHFQFNDFLSRLQNFTKEIVPAYEQYLHLKSELLDLFRKKIKLSQFQSKVLSSFVRNRLIDSVYLPLIGANLAKQIGVAGEQKRTDQMGMLLLISPPGYGKTTLMEYVANRLGIIFVKVNGPAIGHKITSVDPAEAQNSAAREELEKLNLAFEMGDNVMIYIDDIQHCSPEFLQKFISLCDAQRKIEGIYKGAAKTYDFRGKKVCVVMAGNPYTESGEQFKLPDMLANRADTYNLGNIIGDTAEAFEISYIENALTSNAVTAKVASKSIKDIYVFLKLAETGDKTGLEFEGSYSPEEVNEEVAILKKLLYIRDILLKVNSEYIYSASQSDDYREQPSFKLQGSYRNMNKLAEKIVAVMNDEELKTLVLSHYENESQTLTTGAEANLLRFKELAGYLTEKEKQRWEEIKQQFKKNNQMCGLGKDDQMGKLLLQLSALGEGVVGIRQAIENNAEVVESKSGK